MQTDVKPQQPKPESSDGMQRPCDSHREKSNQKATTSAIISSTNNMP